MHKITDNEFKVFAKYIQDVSGIVLDKGKEYLIESRLNPVLDELGCSSFSELYHKTKMDATKNIEKKIVDAISTNETYFFRDVFPFDLLQHKIIPDLIDKRHSRSKGFLPVQIRIWSSASSTGQEVYSIAMVLKELLLNTKEYNIRLLGTDISNTAIKQASYGKYNKFEMSRGLPRDKVEKYFTIEDGDYWRVKDEIRSMAVFKKANLLEPFTGFGKFDIIFCRNVAIYFTPQERQKLYAKIADVLEPDGYLLIGSTESLTNDTNLFEQHKYLRTVFYQPKQKK